MEIRTIRPEESPDFDMLQSIAFAYPVDVEAERKKVAETPEKLDIANKWGCFDDRGKLVAGMVNNAYSIYYDGQIVPMGGIGGVASLPEARMRGSIRAIFQRIFAQEREKGVPFSVLYPFSHAYYRQFGYELCHTAPNYRLPLKALRKYRQTDTARMHTEAEGNEAFRFVYDQYACRYTYAVARDDMAWKSMLHGDPYKNQRYRYILSREGRDVSYCMFGAQQETDGSLTMRVSDFAYVDREALFSLLGFMSKLSAKFEWMWIETPDDFTPDILVEEPDDDMKVYEPSRSMARILNVAQVLEMTRHPQEAGDYTLRVCDAFLPENDGAYRVQFGAGAVDVERMQGDAPCDLTLTVQTLAQLCFGHIPLNMALLKEDVVLMGNEQTPSRVFVKKAKFLADRF